jgi:hypothetical protein
MEQTLTAGGHEVQADAVCARGGTGDRHVVRVTAKCRDVVAHPFKSLPLVEQPVIAGHSVIRILGRERAVHEKPERTQPVVGRDDDDAGFFGEMLPSCEAKLADAATKLPV